MASSCALLPWSDPGHGDRGLPKGALHTDARRQRVNPTLAWLVGRKPGRRCEAWAYIPCTLPLTSPLTRHSQTRGAGVDLALNSLAGDKLHATVRCIASNGALLEIGKYDILQGTGLSMRPMDRNVSFHGINLDTIFASQQRGQVLARACSNLSRPNNDPRCENMRHHALFQMF